MGEVGTFPFGWVRGEGGDNWQIIWDLKTKTIFAEGAVSRKVLPLGESPTWEDAKRFADSVIGDPANYLSDNT